jgi:hypothetical protein
VGRSQHDMTQERAAQRFHQMAVLERQLVLTVDALGAAKAHVKDLQQTYDGLVARLRTAARDEGELPLFNWDEE